MELTENSKARLKNTFEGFNVPPDFYEPVYNYLVYGHQPGGFFTSILANDFMGAMPRSHHSNSVVSLSNLAKWISYYLPEYSAWGSYDTVKYWLMMSSEDRRKVLEKCKLIFTEQEEVIMILKDEKFHA